MKLYSYFRSSAAYRVRIALNLKGLKYDYVPVNLLEREQKSAEYLSDNPQGLVPALMTDDGTVIGQSVAIMEWLEETHPQPALLPTDSLQRAAMRSMVNNITCDIHPILNMAVTNYLQDQLSADEAQIFEWYRTWMERGFQAVETALAKSSGDFCFGDAPSMADCVLVPQVFNADRFKLPMEAYPVIRRVVEHCKQQEAFRAAHPLQQIDAPKQL
ncbi:MAG: maleylacetoacetate isomerase [Halieaceae bacterium]